MNVKSTGQNQTFSFPRRSSSARSSETAAPRAAETECKTCHSKQGIKYSHTVQRVYTLCSLSGRTLKPHKRQKAPRFRLTANSAESTAEGLFCLPPECLRHMLAGSLYHASRMKSSAPIRKPKRQRMTTKQEQARRSERERKTGKRFLRGSDADNLSAEFVESTPQSGESIPPTLRNVKSFAGNGGGRLVYTQAKFSKRGVFSHS